MSSSRLSAFAENPSCKAVDECEEFSASARFRSRRSQVPDGTWRSERRRYPERKLAGTSYNSGQAILLVLLSMAVVLTIVLSIVSRSITDISVSTREEEALRAFSAAEAGVEEALIVGTSVGQTQVGDASFRTDVTGVAAGGNEFAYPIEISSGETMNIWFVSHDTDGSLTCSSQPCFTGSRARFCWGKEGTAGDSVTTPAVEVSVYYTATPGDYSTVRIARDTADPYSDRRARSSFSAPDAGNCQAGGTTYQFQKTVDFASLGIPGGVFNTANGLQFAQVRMFYNTDLSHPVGTSVNFGGNSTLPAQGLKIESTGISGESERKIEVFQGYGEPPAIFTGVLFSPTGITK